VTPATTTWQTDDLCPVCGASLTLTGDGPARSRQDCQACGWSATWDGGTDE
jgi:hypothetical protein